MVCVESGTTYGVRHSLGILGHAHIRQIKGTTALCSREGSVVGSEWEMLISQCQHIAHRSRFKVHVAPQGMKHTHTKMDNHLVELGGEWQEPCLRKMLWVAADISVERATPITVHSAPAHGPAPSMITSEAGAEEYLLPQSCSGVQGLCQDSSDKHLSDSTFHCYMPPPHSQKEKVSNPGNCFPMHFWGNRPGRHMVCPELP